MNAPKFKKYVVGQSVRLANPARLTRKINGSQGVIRQPLPTDVAEVVAVESLVREGVAPTVTAEYVEDGKVIWNAEFSAEELEHVVG